MPYPISLMEASSWDSHVFYFRIRKVMGKMLTMKINLKSVLCL